MVVVASLEDRHTLAIARLDDARFDGVGGASRLDPALGPDGHARAELGLRCEPATPCQPAMWHRRVLGLVAPIGGDRLMVCAGFHDVFPTSLRYTGASFHMPP